MSQRRHRGLVKLFFSVVLGSFVLFTSLSLGQLTEATLKGTVADTTGAVLAHASVAAVNQGTGQVRSTTSDASGDFSLPDLPSGTYTVRVSVSGFKTFEQRNLELYVGKVTELDARLELGAIKETVVVRAQAATVPVSNEGRLSDTLQHNQIAELPIPQRDLFFLPSLSAGATNLPGGNYAYKLIVSPAITVNGNRFRGNNYVLDGSMDTDIINAGEPAIVPSLESVEEVQVQTGNFSSEYGRGNGSVVNIRTNSGSNELHGKLWEFNKNTAMDARNFFAASKPPLVYNQFGGNFGGPIIRNKTFFFGSYEGTRDVLGQTIGFQVETPEFRNYVLNNSPSSIAARLFKQFPAPTPASGSGGQEYAGQVNVTTPLGTTIPALGTTEHTLGDYLRSNQYLGRVDHTLSSKDTLTGRLITEGVRTNGGAISSTKVTTQGEAMRGFLDPAELFFGNLNIGEVHVFNHTVNDARFSFIEDNSKFSRPTAQYPVINITGVTAQFGDPNPFLNRLRTYEGRDTVSFVRGRHLVRTGFELRKLFLGLNLGTSNAGTYYFNSILAFAADNPYEQVLTVDPATGQPIRADRDYAIHETALFIQDDWKATSRLTLNLGIRHDYFGDPSERNGRLTNVTWGSGSTYSERFANAGVGKVSQLFHARKLNFSPRIGLAYDPFGDGKSSIRSGYSLAYEPTHGRTLLSETTNPPFDIQAILEPSVGIGTNILYGIPVPFNPEFQTALNSQGGMVATPGKAPIRIAPWIVNPNLKTQYSESWFFNLERQVAPNWIVNVGYVGTNGFHLERRDDINRYDGDLADGTLNRINSNFGGVTYVDNSATSSYNALTIEVLHRIGSGLTLQANYRWSKWIDDSSDTDGSSFADNPEPPSDAGAQNNNCLRCDRALSEFDIPRRFTASAVWTPKVSTGNSLVNHLGRNWQVSTIIVAQSGRPFGVYCAASHAAGCDYNEDGGGGIGNNAYYDRPNAPASGAIKASFGKQHFLRGVFAPTIFPKPAAGTDGNLGRDVYRGPHQVNVDLALARSFRLWEDKELQFRVDAFNAFNNVDLYLPSGNLALALTPSGSFSPTSSFGKSTQAFDPRIFQIGLKFAF